MSEERPKKISVVVPCFNAVDKIGRCIASLRNSDMPAREYEVLFVDDCSMDGTFELLERECDREENWRLVRLEKNSGSPSRPRNRAIALAQGEYIFFLDCDDEVLPDTLRVHYDHAILSRADVLRGYLIVDDGRGRKAMNRLADWKPEWTRQEKIHAMISRQSTTVGSLVHSRLLRSSGIAWPEDIRMGEDTVFLVSVLAAAERIEYIDHGCFVYHRMPALTASSTQVYGARELSDHLKVWQKVQALLAPEGIDYVKSRLKVGFHYALSSLIKRNKGDIDASLFEKLRVFVLAHLPVIERFNYATRYREIVDAIIAGDFQEFQSLCRPRLLIAGYDLKFILPAVPELSRHFDIRIDEWRGHDAHDEGQSQGLLRWAELVWCEWMLGNAVWYAAHKRPDQRLVVRTHRFELSRDFGEKLNAENVDATVAVSVHFLELMLERFPRLTRAKTRLVPNFIVDGGYERSWSERRLHTLGMIGILPARKGLDRALDVLERLRRVDPRYRLEVFGRTPDEEPWIAKDEREMAYFSDCMAFIQSRGLADAVSFNGQSNIRTALAEKNVGFVLSTSDSPRQLPGPESFHLAVADAFEGGGIGLVLSWAGAEYVWPDEFRLPTVEAIVERILAYRDEGDAFRQASDRGHSFIAERYGRDAFVRRVKQMFMELV